MTPAERKEVESLLVQHRDHLQSALERADRFTSGIHGLIAVQLRVLLCDSEFPVLLEYADEKMLNLYVFGPVQPSEFFQKHRVVHMQTQIIGREYWYKSQLFDVQSYLDCMIQTVSRIGGKWEDSGEIVTPTKLIKWVANKDGFSHFDLKKPNAFASFKTWTRVDALGQTDEFMVKECLFQIARWTIGIIDAVLVAKVGDKVT